MTELVSVILPVYNCEKYLDDCLASISGQDYPNIEVLVLVDGGDDNSQKIAVNYSGKVDGVKVLYHRENRGLVYTLNEGVSLAKGRYIARMDGDDVCRSDRISKQVEFLKKNHEIAMCGSAMRIIDEAGKFVRKRSVYKSHEAIKASLYFGNPVCHPTVMFDLKRIKRKELVYSGRYEHIEDFELWCRLMSLGYRFGNLEDSLVEYRLSTNGVSRKFLDKQIANSICVLEEYRSGMLLGCSMRRLHRNEYSLISLYRGVLEMMYLNFMEKKHPATALIYATIYEVIKSTCRNVTRMIK